MIERHSALGTGSSHHGHGEEGGVELSFRFGPETLENIAPSVCVRRRSNTWTSYRVSSICIVLACHQAGNAEGRLDL